MNLLVVVYLGGYVTYTSYRVDNSDGIGCWLRVIWSRSVSFTHFSSSELIESAISWFLTDQGEWNIMSNYTRSNAWDHNGTFENSDLFWYAKGVGVMQSRSLDDPNSWWFFAAIHGEYVYTPQRGYPGWAYIPPTPAVPTSPLPSQAVYDTYWNQCQHQSWYFLPWHRGYLIALEQQLREAIIGLGGPKNWALPYWNYLGAGAEYKMPPAFQQRTLPDATPNPLFVTARYGPQGDADIYIPIPPVSRQCMSNDLFTGSNINTPRPGFGGPETGFSHNGRQSGNLESNPHNQVHVDVGGEAPDGSLWGLMSDPGIAALDPIFYLHHANIDRMWAVWNASGNVNPTSDKWLQGPAAAGERGFIMPKPGATPWVYTPQEVDDMAKVDYTYAGLSAEAAQPVSATLPSTKRMAQFGVEFSEAVLMADNSDSDSELLGAQDGRQKIESSGLRASVKLDSGARNKMLSSFAAASASAPPNRAYLQLENVRGTRDANKLNVFVNGSPAGSVALFGLRRASMKDGEHGGSGLTLEVDITSIIDTLHLDNALDVDALDVQILPERGVAAEAELSVGRISIYREGNL
ncbi:tyrosinase family protein [Arenicella xantha]|uniref:Tyrosinase n=1 Tax=Arenicella xantha TaxID=644221 RepID=A0A395JKA0_9GAMM|nr:tyrosinase family protein [Arenicella xantha]RBP51162.1 tyrosinase [Arenicella xantha]